jgi:hypothetical protein
MPKELDMSDKVLERDDEKYIAQGIDQALCDGLVGDAWDKVHPVKVGQYIVYNGVGEFEGVVDDIAAAHKMQADWCNTI